MWKKRSLAVARRRIPFEATLPVHSIDDVIHDSFADH